MCHNTDQPKLFIDRLTSADLTSLVEIEQACYVDPWNPEMFGRELSARAYNCPLGGRWPAESGLTLPRGGPAQSPEGTREMHPDDEVVAPPPNTPLIGFVIAHLLGVETHILNLAVDPEYQGQGYGRALLYALLNYAAERGERRAILEVRESNKKAQALYVSAGFRVIGQRRNYYEKEKENALVMLLDPMRPVFPRCYVLDPGLAVAGPRRTESGPST